MKGAKIPLRVQSTRIFKLFRKFKAAPHNCTIVSAAFAFSTTAIPLSKGDGRCVVVSLLNNFSPKNVKQ